MHRVQRFDERVLGAGVLGAFEHFRIAAGDDAHLAVGRALRFDFAEHVDAAAVGEHQVQQDPVGLPAEAADAVGDGAGFRHRKAGLLQDQRDRLARGQVVFHDQDGRRRRCCRCRRLRRRAGRRLR